MPPPPSIDRHSQEPLLRRLDQICSNLNAVLLAIALGLAALDLTVFVSLRFSDTLARGQVGEPASTQAAHAADNRTDHPTSPR